MNKVERSPLQIDIERMLLEGVSTRKISAWCLTHGEEIDHVTINNHAKKLDMTPEGIEEYNHQLKLQRMQPHIQQKVNDLLFCDDLIKIAKKIELKVDEDSGITALDIKKLGLQALQIKHKILKEDPLSRKIVKDQEMDKDPQKRSDARKMMVELVGNTEE